MTPEQRAEKHVKICIDAWLGSGSVAWDNLLMDHFVQIQKEVLESRRGGKGRGGLMRRLFPMWITSEESQMYQLNHKAMLEKSLRIAWTGISDNVCAKCSHPRCRIGRGIMDRIEALGGKK